MTTLFSRSLLTVLLIVLATDVRAGGNFSLADAEQSITVDDLKEHVKVLASDTFEGREAGSRGGTAVGVYLGEQFQKHKLAGGATPKDYYQYFRGNCRNILGVVHGADPQLKDEVIVFGAHYDHVGYGTAENSRGPTGYIHNGADDNASGAAALVEMVEAIANLNTAPRRTILFALWDAEEKGLWGSQHWVAAPTIPRENIKLMLNVDMIGRLRQHVLTCYGVRTSPGLRRLISSHNHYDDLEIDFTWELPDNSDHWPFVQRQMPILMFHTGLHDDYHTPNDDLDKLNYEGICDISRLMFHVAWDLANRDEIPPFRSRALAETVARQREVERGLPPRPSRLGVQWSELSQPDAGIRIDQVRTGSPAQQAGLAAGDRVIKINGRPVKTGGSFLSQVLTAPSPAEFTVEHGSAAEPATIRVPLSGAPLLLGISWRTDDAEPGCLILTRVVPASPAARAGLQLNDRIYKIGDKEVADIGKVTAAAFYEQPNAKLLIERRGQVKTVEIPTVNSPAP